MKQILPHIKQEEIYGKCWLFAIKFAEDSVFAVRKEACKVITKLMLSLAPLSLSYKRLC